MSFPWESKAIGDPMTHGLSRLSLRRTERESPAQGHVPIVFPN